MVISQDHNFSGKINRRKSEVSSHEEILGGIKLAVSKGESLKQVMMTFFNAGYPREEIEEAARAFQSGEMQQKEVKQPEQKMPEEKPEKKKSFFSIFKPKKPAQKVSTYGESEKQVSQPMKETEIKQPSEIKKPIEKTETKPQEISKQKISNYKETKPKNKLAMIVFIISIILILGLLAAVFLFRQELIDLLSRQ